MKEKNFRKLNFIVLILFPIMLLIFSITYNIYSVGTTNRIKNELENFTNSLSLRLESKYMDMMSLYFKDELNNYTIANEFTNLVKKQVRLGITPHFNSLKLSIDYTIKNNIRNTTYAVLFIAVLMFILTLVLNFTSNSFSSANNAPAAKTYKPETVKEKPKVINDVVDNSYSDSIKSEIEAMYKNLVNEIKNSRDEKALEILEKMFQIDERNYLALNGAGILHTKIYSRDNKEEQFKKADKYFEYASSLFANNDNISNNKGILYSIRYEVKKMEDDYEKALIIFNDVLSSNYLDSELLNNRGTLYSVKYKIKGDDELFKKALKDYNDLIEMDFNNIYALNNRSALFFNKYKYSGDKNYFDKSIEDCNTAFKINSSEALYDNTGSLYIYKF